MTKLILWNDVAITVDDEAVAKLFVKETTSASLERLRARVREILRECIVEAAPSTEPPSSDVH